MFKNKYKNIITEVDGIKFKSKKEAKRYSELKLLFAAGEVIHFNWQVPLRLSKSGVRPITYYADFFVIFKDGSWRYEDTKGFRTQVYKLKKRLVKDVFGIDIFEI